MIAERAMAWKYMLKLIIADSEKELGFHVGLHTPLIRAIEAIEEIRRLDTSPDCGTIRA